MKAPLLLDECTDPAIIAGLLLLEPSMDILRVGAAGTPVSGTPDPVLLIAAQALGRVLVTNDRKTMPVHLHQHFAAGCHTAGVVLLRGGFVLGAYIQSILTEWRATEADDWIDRTVYLP